MWFLYSFLRLIVITNNGFLRLTLVKCFRLDPLGNRLWGEICTQGLLGSALGDDALRKEGSNWAQGNVELRYTHNRSFSQSHQETWSLCGLSEFSCPEARTLTFVFSPSTTMGYPRGGSVNSRRWCFCSKGSELSAFSTSRTSGFEYLSHEESRPYYSL